MIKVVLSKKGALIDATIIEAPINKSNGKKNGLIKMLVPLKRINLVSWLQGSHGFRFWLKLNC